MQYATLEVESRDGVAEIRLTRPDVLNRFDEPLHVEFVSALSALRSDASVRAVLLTSTGKVFSAGGDFDLMRRANASATARNTTIQQAREVISALLTLPQPLVAAVHGSAIGLGATVVLACDAVVSARTAYLSDAHVTMALAAGDGGALVWPQSTGMLRARRYLLTGEAIEAERAYQFGLITDLVDTADQVGPEARRLAQKLAGLPPLAVQGTKRALNQVAQLRAAEVVEIALLHESVTLASDDLLEALSAFQEKRRGHYSGT